jgi:hypothetical protein
VLCLACALHRDIVHLKQVSFHPFLAYCTAAQTQKLEFILYFLQLPVHGASWAKKA